MSNIGDSFRGSDFDDDDEEHDVGDDDEDDNESLFARAEAAELESKNKADLIRQLNDAPPPRGVGIDVVLNPGGWPVVTSLAEGGPAHKSGITCLARRVSSCGRAICLSSVVLCAFCCSVLAFLDGQGCLVCINPSPTLFRQAQFWSATSSVR